MPRDKKYISEVLLDLAALAALEAGEAIMQIYRQKDFSVRLKADDSPVTEADLKANAIISAILYRSGLPVLSEEGRDIPFGERKEWGLFWLVDPLDGTKEFVDHSGEFTVNIALVDRQMPVAGVVYDPVNDFLYAGAVDHGAVKIPAASVMAADLASGHLSRLTSGPVTGLLCGEDDKADFQPGAGISPGEAPGSDADSGSGSNSGSNNGNSSGPVTRPGAGDSTAPSPGPNSGLSSGLVGGLISGISPGMYPGHKVLPLSYSVGKGPGIAGSRSFMDDRTRLFIDRFRDLFPESRVIIRGSSLKLCMIATGEADIYPRLSYISEWDTAAGHAIVLAAGGSVVQATDTSRPLVYNKQSPCNPWFIAFRDPGLLKSVTSLIPQ